MCISLSEAMRSGNDPVHEGRSQDPGRMPAETAFAGEGRKDGSAAEIGNHFKQAHVKLRYPRVPMRPLIYPHPAILFTLLSSRGTLKHVRPGDGRDSVMLEACLYSPTHARTRAPPGSIPDHMSLQGGLGLEPHCTGRGLQSCLGFGCVVRLASSAWLGPAYVLMGLSPVCC
ncbi:uncharacterized protein LY79DRAFT_553802 [Colletotrichum navitas]|uniref:Uncharacterized protein n=1 Tax=Colletotrichum navitas TaxID=681940 RepID=A0AAD8PZ01_9PEZI|nr:uncharacterized protein LY79DRAFT_553802 [Colletotrichum navitas]KAK1590713.1 hypothetical protein LY79DRAFT_553802 [Colletotrichum navitas]